MARLKCSMRTAVFLTSEEYTSEPTMGQKGTFLPSSCEMPRASAVFPVPGAPAIGVSGISHQKPASAARVQLKSWLQGLCHPPLQVQCNHRHVTCEHTMHWIVMSCVCLSPARSSARPAIFLSWIISTISPHASLACSWPTKPANAQRLYTDSSLFPSDSKIRQDWSHSSLPCLL